eukprot:jgi/Tetstr1/448173/TSEL_035464.t1
MTIPLGALGSTGRIVDEDTGIPYPLKKTSRFPIAAPPYIERICYATFNYRAGYTAANHIYATETVLAAFREYTSSPFLPAPFRPSVWVVLTVHFVMDKKGLAAKPIGDVLPSRQVPPLNVEFKDGEEVCEVVSLPLAGTAASPKLHNLVDVLAQQQKRAGGIIKHDTNAVVNLAATQAVPGDNVDEGSCPEPPAKKAKQPAKLAAGVPARGRGGAGARAGSGTFGSRGLAARPP